MERPDDSGAAGGRKLHLAGAATTRGRSHRYDVVTGRVRTASKMR